MIYLPSKIETVKNNFNLWPEVIPTSNGKFDKCFMKRSVLSIVLCELTSSKFIVETHTKSISNSHTFFFLFFSVVFYMFVFQGEGKRGRDRKYSA